LRFAWPSAIRSGQKAHIDGKAATGEHALGSAGDTWVHRTAEHDHLTVAKMRRHVLQSARHCIRVRVQMLVDRGADDDDDTLAAADDTRIRGGGQGPGEQGLA
jgi:hypothetical protein